MKETNVSIEKLKNVPKTLLIPLYMRYLETIKDKDRLMEDALCEYAVNHVDFEFSQWDDEDAMQLGIVVRSCIYDDVVRNYINENPESTIIQFGSGLDTRFNRVDNGRIIWVDIDFPEVIELREKLFDNRDKDRWKFISGDIFDYEWFEKIPKDRRIFFLTEGVLLYYPENQVKDLLKEIADRYPSCEIIIDAITNLYIMFGGREFTHLLKDDQNHLPFKWLYNNTADLLSWHPSFKLVRELSVMEYYGSRCPSDLKEAMADSEKIRDMVKVIHLSC